MIVMKRVFRIFNLKCYKVNVRYVHPYKIKDYRSYELAEELLKNLIYYDKGIVVLNKPYGISFAQTVNKKESFASDTLYPILKKKLSCKELLPAKVPERYASGVAVFCTNESVLKAVQKCIRSMRGTKQSAEIYDCIVIGQPAVEIGKFEGGITIEQSSNGKQKGVKFVKECSKNRVRNGEVKPVVLQHSTLSLGDHASRLIISVTRTCWHSVRAYAARELVSPILGDRVFGRFVRTVFGKEVLIDNFSPVANQPQTLSGELLSKLELSSRKDIEIPLHLHLVRVQLRNVLGKEFEFIAQPPEHFLWTCEVLHLKETPEFETTIDLKTKNV